MDTVEVWHHKRCAAVFDRELLRFWLAQPDAPLEVDEVVFSLDRAVDQDGRVAISLLDVVCWTFSPVTLKSLRKRV
jgi:hypothetical protein